MDFLQNVLLVILVIVCVGLVAVILLQRSEGGALGMGGGGGGLMTARGAGNLLTRTTAILGGAFFVLAITLTILGNMERSQSATGRFGSSLKINPLAPTAAAQRPAARNEKRANAQVSRFLFKPFLLSSLFRVRGRRMVRT